MVKCHMLHNENLYTPYALPDNNLDNAQIKSLNSHDFVTSIAGISGGQH